MASDVSYGASISVGTQLTFTANILKPFSDYEFQVRILDSIFAATVPYFIT